jgi:polysaccharide pyruvyl transferase WcaK-like protein
VTRAARRSHTDVGFFGRLGSGNYGNDGSFEAVLRFLRRNRPDLTLDAMCSGPEVLSARYGLPAEQMHWDRGGHRVSRVRLVERTMTAGRVLTGAVVDAVRTARWVRSHAVVIVPGMGTFESTMPVRPWQVPWSLFVVAAAGRAFGVRTAFVSVGVSPADDPVSRALLKTTLRWATYRSYRDDYSRQMAADAGVDVAGDEVFPDLAFALPVPSTIVDHPGVIGVGVIDWRGTASDRAAAANLFETYLGEMVTLVGGLVDDGQQVRLLGGDDHDADVAQTVAHLVLAERPDVDSDQVRYVPVASLEDFMDVLSGLHLLVGSRFHNVLCGLRCGVPTVAVGYAEKHRVLMDRFGQGSLVHAIRGLRADEVRASVDEAAANHDRISLHLRQVAEDEHQGVRRQLAALGALVHDQGHRHDLRGSTTTRW